LETPSGLPAFASQPDLFKVFHYIPYLGLAMAFQRFSPARGIFRSEWVGFENFIELFSLGDFYKVFANTIIINIHKLVSGSGR